MLVRARAPLRLGLAGGGTDVSPYCDEFGGCVLNATIDRYAYAVIKPLNEDSIELHAADQNLKFKYPISNNLHLDGNLNLHKAVYNAMIQEFNDGKPLNISLTTFCDAPAGSGLGSSSTLVVTMIKAFVELLNLPLDDYLIAKLAYRIERIDCGLNGGRQDQFSATFGGINFIEFQENGKTLVNPLRVKNWILCELEASLILFYTGVSRESARIIEEQSINMRNKEEGKIASFHAIKQEALTMKESLLKGDFNGIAQSMLDGWKNKKNSAITVSNSNIDSIYNAAISSGAKAGKVSGAGGGGFMLFFAPPESRMNVINTLKKFNGQISNAHFTKNGAQAWRIL